MKGRDIMRRFIPNSPHAAALGIELVAIAADRADLRLPFTPQLATVGTIVHGGAIATLADCAIMCAAWATDHPPANSRGLTVSLNMTFVDAASSETLTATGVVVRRGRSLVTCRADVYGADGRTVACALATYKLG